MFSLIHSLHRFKAGGYFASRSLPGRDQSGQNSRDSCQKQPEYDDSPARMEYDAQPFNRQAKLTPRGYGNSGQDPKEPTGKAYDHALRNDQSGHKGICTQASALLRDL